MARTRSFDETKALAAMGDVFWRKGFEGASYAELMKASGLGKGSLYAAWGDKAALYRAALAQYVEAELALLAEVLTAPGANPLASLTALLTYPIEAVEERRDRRGCFLCNAAVDMAQMDAETAVMVEEAFGAAIDAVEGVAVRAGGAPGAGAHLFSVFLGLRVMARAGVSAERMRAARDVALRPYAALN